MLRPMLQIGKKPRAVDPEDPQGLLLDCHTRIRNFSALSVRLASAEAAPDAEIADAAARVHRYYTVALPLHQQDEEQSMAPRLPASEAISTMRAQHVTIDRAMEPLLVQWERVSREPGRRSELRLADAQALDALWVQHLALEESQIFPQLATLPRDLRSAITQEMRARRR